jgi:hypothetical protein
VRVPFEWKPGAWQEAARNQEEYRQNWLNSEARGALGVSVQVQSKWWWTEGGESRAGRDKEQGEGERARRLGALGVREVGTGSKGLERESHRPF